ncbi:hypothetical protein V6957_003700 [Vibrio parahaemolyticus]|uniref:hypothetical protein n=1 Tax=Vibrio parahaemolyticus TaxID=670 RepID=UPI00112490CE|nr:hypothetical protein [Vibrio parahaemolyticus]QQD06378.1 hypothetical protein JCT85_23260 [Vibrio parahaemolyticus]TOF19328.1 hypothetical protein CGJ26_19970 [Vibrio parahaemolyticus]HCH1893857.1 hypothetical protein [Vibrio parahaemolyticus]HCH5023334.1 hypothetical protein [Vibrio parahaemolyticus]
MEKLGENLMVLGAMMIASGFILSIDLSMTGKDFLTNPILYAPKSMLNAVLPDAFIAWWSETTSHLSSLKNMLLLVGGGILLVAFIVAVKRFPSQERIELLIILCTGIFAVLSLTGGTMVIGSFKVLPWFVTLPMFLSLIPIVLLFGFLPALIAVKLGVYPKSKVQEAWRLVKIFFRPNQKNEY